MFKAKKIEYLTAEEMNKHLVVINECYKIVKGPKKDKEPFGLRAFIEDKLVEFRLTYKKGSKVTTYVTRKDKNEKRQETSGLKAYAIGQRYFKTPDMVQVCSKSAKYSYTFKKFMFSAKPILWKNEEYEGKWVEAYSYDVNSSYSFAMLKEMPDTSVLPREGKVKEGEVGFREDSTGNFVPCFTGSYSLWIFPLIPSPFVKFVKVWYDKKINAHSKQEKEKAKETLNYYVGYLQKKNPFMRAMILYHANSFISSFMDSNTIYCNTDSLVSIVPRKDIITGQGIGQFKLEKKGKFIFKGFNYQWKGEPPSMRGIPKSWFKKDFDLAVDTIPKFGNVYEYKDGLLKEVLYEGLQEKE